MKFHYYAETDSLYIDLADRPGAESREVAPDGAPRVGDNQFGVKHGDIRVIAKKIKSDHELALKLWDTGNVDEG